MSTTRPATEDQIIALLKAKLATSVQIDSLPLGLKDRKALDVRSAAVWVVYAGSTSKPNQAAGALVQPETWNWSTLVLAKKYRSAQAAGDAALELLQSVIDILAGEETDAGKLTKSKDTILGLPEGCGIVGYEAVFSLETYLRRTS
ncbi:MAG: hypothetical protein WC340_14380 [Kiritimatiellia bacterium]